MDHVGDVWRMENTSMHLHYNSFRAFYTWIFWLWAKAWLVDIWWDHKAAFVAPPWEFFFFPVRLWFTEAIIYFSTGSKNLVHSAVIKMRGAVKWLHPGGIMRREYYATNVQIVKTGLPINKWLLGLDLKIRRVWQRSSFTAICGSWEKTIWQKRQQVFCK